MKKVSIIMSAYNEKEEWIKESIDSIINQTYKNIEFIIVLDNPHNLKLKEVLSKYKNLDNRIKLIVNKQNLGLVESLNKALNEASGEYIARMDADDISLKNRIEEQVKYLENHQDISLVATQVEYIDENNKKIYIPPNYGIRQESAKKSLKYRNVFMHPTWMFRRSILIDLKKYNNIPTAEDYDFLCRLSLNGYNFIKIKKVLCKYRIRESSITNSKKMYQKNVTDILKKRYRKAQKENILDFYDIERILEDIKRIDNNNNNNNRYWEANKKYNIGIKKIMNKNLIIGSILILYSLIINKDKLDDIKDSIALKFINR